MLSSVATVHAFATTARSPQFVCRTTVTAALDQPEAWTEWSLRDVGLFDGAAVLFTVASLFAANALVNAQSASVKPSPRVTVDDEALSSMDALSSPPPSNDPMELQPFADLWPRPKKNARGGSAEMTVSDDDGEPAKALSPLAMAAAEVLEEEEDELAAYWERYDDAKAGEAMRPQRRMPEWDGSPTTKGSSATRTDELLNRYYAAQGIDKVAEDAARDGIEAARGQARLELARGHPLAAVLTLEVLQQQGLLQPHSKLGSAALLELASYHEHSDQEERARAIYESLGSHPQTDVRREARSLLTSVTSRTRRLSGRAGSWWSLPVPWDRNSKR